MPPSATPQIEHALTKREIAVVQDDWKKVERMGETVATLLYERLFELDPKLRTMFADDMSEQKAKLFRMIGAAVYGLSDPEILSPILQHLGRKHADLGVVDYDYATIGDALMWTLRQGLGTEFGPESEAAWIKVYGLFADSMSPGRW